MFRKERGRGQRRQYILRWDWMLTLGVKQMLPFWMVAACVLLVSSRQNLGGGDYLYHAESKCPSPSWIFRKEDSPLLMPCVFTEEVGHSTMEPAAVGTLPLHNTLSVMCSNYSEPPPPPESCYFILQMHMDMTFNIVTECRMTGFYCASSTTWCQVKSEHKATWQTGKHGAFSKAWALN